MTPLLVRLERAGDLLDLSASSIKRLVKAGDVPAVKVAGATRVRVADLAAYVDGLRKAETTPNGGTAA